MTEQWRSIKDFEGRYEISDMGRVRSLARWVRHPAGGQRLLGTRILKLHPTPKGYLSAHLYVDGTTRRNMNVQRMVAVAFIPNPQNLPQVDHENRNRENNRVKNLKWVTVVDNVLKGEEHSSAVLTADQVRYIRSHLAAGATHSDLAGLFGVSTTTIGKIKHRQIWKSIQ